MGTRRNVVRFIEKEIKTYKALSLFFSKKSTEEHVRVGEEKVLARPSFYKARMKEARELVHELRNPD